MAPLVVRLKAPRVLLLSASIKALKVVLLAALVVVFPAVPTAMLILSALVVLLKPPIALSLPTEVVLRLPVISMAMFLALQRVRFAPRPLPRTN